MNIKEVTDFIYEIIINGLKQKQSLNEIKRSISDYFEYLDTQNLLNNDIIILFENVLDDFERLVSKWPNLEKIDISILRIQRPIINQNVIVTSDNCSGSRSTRSNC